MTLSASSEPEPARRRAASPSSTTSKPSAAPSLPTCAELGPEARHFRAIIEALGVLGQASAEEIGDHTGLGMVAVARRLPELEKLGHVAPVGRLSQNRSGRAGRVWTLAGA